MEVFEEYRLKKSFIPIIKNGKIIEGDKYGGILLIYNKRLVYYKKLRILGITLQIPKYISKKSKVSFIKPFKKYWDVKQDRLSPNYWGKSIKQKPLTNIWCRLNRSDYSDFKIAISSNIVYEKKYLNHNIRKLLDQIPNKIIIEPFKL